MPTNWINVYLAIFTVGSFFLYACGSSATIIPTSSSTIAITEVNTVKSHSVFVPPAGKTLFILGQDNETIREYLQAIPDPQPGGFTSYTSLDRLEGLTSKVNYGAGPVFLDELALEQPESVLVLGLYLVDYLEAIPSGLADDKIDRLLDTLESYQRPVYLRFGYEFDGSWNRYDPQLFIQAWQYFHDRLQSRGIANIAMVWQSAAYCRGTHQGKPSYAWYPGDEYVDWIGLSYFTQTDCQLKPLLDILDFARQHGKPVMVAEAAPQRYDIGKLTYSSDGNFFEQRTADQIWDEWYVPFFEFLHQNEDVIRAVAYINTFWDSQAMWASPYMNGYWGDSRVQVNETIKASWLAELGHATWLMTNPDLFKDLGFTQ